MANYANLLATIAANIYTNGNNEVTAAMVKTAVDQMVASLGAGYQFMGVATPATTPGDTDVKQFYIASTPGTYTNFLDSGSDPLEVNDGEVAVLKYDTSWSKDVTGIATAAALAESEQQVGELNLISLVEAGFTDIEVGTIDSSGANTASTRRLRMTNAIASEGVVGVPDGFQVRAAFYYSAWTDPDNYTFAAEVTGLTGHSIRLDPSYPYVRLVFRWYESDAVITREDLVGQMSFPANEYVKAVDYREGFNKFNQLINDCVIEMEQGTINASGENVAETARLRTANAISTNTPKVWLPEGFIANAIFYYSSWEDALNFTYVDYVVNQKDFIVFDKTYPYARFLVRREDSTDLTPDDFLAGFQLVPRAIRRAAFMGDSITQGVYSYWNGGGHAETDRYNGFDITDLTDVAMATDYNGIHHYFGQYAKSFRVTNLAKRGSGWVADSRNIGNAKDVVDTYDFSDTDFVALCFGVNDYIQGATIGDISTQAAGTIIGNMCYVIEKILTDNPLCKIVVYSPYNTWGQVSYGGDYTSNVLYGDESTNYALGYAIGGNTLQDIIDAETEVCDHYGIQIVDLSRSNVVNRFTIKEILIDGLHPSKASYPKLAAEIFGKGNFGD